MATKGLGRGLNAFFDDIEEVKSVSETKKAVIDKVVELNMAEVEPMLNQPRKVFDKKNNKIMGASFILFISYYDCF